MPTFTLRNADAVAFEAALLSGAEVSVVLPAIADGAADEDGIASVGERGHAPPWEEPRRDVPGVGFGVER